MAKQLKLRITRVITSSFQSCRSKDPSILPSSHPVPLFSRFSPHDHHSSDYTHRPPPPSSAAKHHRSSAAASNSNNQQLLHWQNKEEEWQLVYHNSSTTKKQPHKNYKKTSTESSRTFSSDSSPTSSSTEFDHFNPNKHKKPRKKKKKRRNNRKVCISSNGLCRLSVSSSSSPARLSVFKKLIPNLMEGKVKDSFAVVKKSEDPYDDFKRSMMDMIWEKQMFDESELQQLLECFLSLNSPRHHNVIVQVFAEIWNAMFTTTRYPS